VLSSLDLPETNSCPPTLSWLQLRSRPVLSSSSVHLLCVLLLPLFLIALVRGPLNLRLSWCAHVHELLSSPLVCLWCDRSLRRRPRRRHLHLHLSAPPPAAPLSLWLNSVQPSPVSAVRCPSVATGPPFSGQLTPGAARLELPVDSAGSARRVCVSTSVCTPTPQYSTWLCPALTSPALFPISCTPPTYRPYRSPLLGTANHRYAGGFHPSHRIKMAERDAKPI